ncbi:regulatory protein, luxR family [Tistlia consotensis]|uniref:Regulatory protein, luxR family n=1 Tax=Tistlia consotensis USBA 355 TaxID=560819 RepID=A0A1Y6CJ44_9PROT|nr:helix-turn-helix transcriptional regulator [Tistlia consotensis]SMF65348.1 regulatory protein, luxR family [Tistlia consotensis USBA 355]SNS03852.1 regulatory protein, luxR family [Tistlia consotensis]
MTERQDGAEERALARAVLAIGSSEFVTAALDYLRSVAPFFGAFLVIVDGRRPPLHVYDNVRAEKRAEVVDRYLDGAYLLDPFYALCLERPGNALMRLRDVMPDRFPHSEYFRRYYSLTNLVDEVALLVELTPSRYLFYSVGRRFGERRFGSRELDALRRVLPVFAALNQRHFGLAHLRGQGVPQTQGPREAAPIGESTPGERSRLLREDRSVSAALAAFGTEALSNREQEVAGLILKGHSSDSIARLIGISRGTVKIHRKNLYRKLRISSQSELFARFLQGLE